MKTLIALLALIALFTLTSCDGGGDAQADQEKLESILEQLTTITEDTVTEVVDRYVDSEFEWYIGYGLVNAVAAAGWDGADSSTLWYSFAKRFVQTTNSAEWMLAPDLAVVKAKGTLTPHDERGFGQLMTGVFEKKDGQWYLVHMHSVFMKCPIDC